jgi:guanylate kinase
VAGSAGLAPEQFQVVVISGPSGTGKTTLVSRLVGECPVKLRKSISATTRPRRPGEVDGDDYYFLSRPEFEARQVAGEFLEFAEVHKTGYLYGTLRGELERARDAGAWALLEIDVHGALSVMQQYPGAITIFLRTPSEAEFERRLRARGTESEEMIARRLATAREELKSASRYRFQVVNDELDRAVREICEILSSEGNKQHAG